MRHHHLPPFIDASCRREPDLEAHFPAISALCHTTHFAPRLQRGDQVAYMTCKFRLAPQAACRYLVAILEIHERFESHAAAAEWYRAHGLPLPSNCLVEGNPPQPYEKTGGLRAADARRFCARSGNRGAVRNWDAAYAARASQCGVLLACRVLHRALHSPPALTEAVLIEIFDRVPGTQNPPQIAKQQMRKLVALMRGH